MEIKNAVIKKADLVFEDVNGKNGQQFSLILYLLIDDKSGVNVWFNPLKLPQLLEKLKLEKFSELEGTYIQIKGGGFGEEVEGIKPILSNSNEKWFESDNGIYFGSEFIKMWDKYVNDLEME